MSQVKVAAVQFSCCDNVDRNIERAEDLVRNAAEKGAHVILLQELFSSVYFPIDQTDCSDLAVSYNDNGAQVNHGLTPSSSYVEKFRKLAEELKVVLPLSFYERCHNVFYNSVKVFDADGQDVGTYRKSHIPDGPGYQEKFYFTPGQTGFQVIQTRYCRLGVAICWDQWFPEVARSLVLQGADILLYPTAIGSEPHLPGFDSSAHWRRCIVGHAAANIVPVVVANRTGLEKSKVSGNEITFYGSSFITDQFGEIVAEAGRQDDGKVIIASFDVQRVMKDRWQWGLFRDRRPELYGAITAVDNAPQQTK